MSAGTLTHDSRRPFPAPFDARALVTDPAVLTIAALTILGGGLRFALIGHQGFWFDEANTALLVRFSPGKMLGLLPQVESTPPLYYCLAWVWARLFGFSEDPLRSLSALAGVLTIPIAYGAARKLLSRRAGVIAAGLTACSPLLIWYSQEARSYALLVFVSSVTLMAFAYAREDPTARTLTVWVLACASALATHYYAALVVVPEALWLLACSRRRVRLTGVAVGAVTLCGLALIPLAASQNASGHALWIAPIPLDQRLGQIIPQFLIGFQTPAQTVVEPAAGAMAIIGLALLAVRADAAERCGALVAGSVAIGGVVLNLLLIAGGVDDLLTRNVIVLWMPAALVIAAGLGARRAGGIGIAAAVVLCALGVFAAINVDADRSFQRPDWRPVARLLGERPTPDSTRAILVQHYRDLLPLSLYLPHLRNWGHARRARVSELEIIAIKAPRVPLCWWGAACNLTPSAMQRTYPIRGFHELWTRHAHQFTVMRLVSAKPVALTATMVSRALTATTLRHDELLLQRY